LKKIVKERVLALKVPVKEAQKVKENLIKKNVFSVDYKLIKEKGFIYFPILKKIKTKFGIVNVELEKYKKQQTNFKEELRKILSIKEMEMIKTAFDVIGDIAILEIDEPLQKKEKLIAETLLKMHKNINTVGRKHGPHHGVFRTQDVKILAGQRKKETTHIENGVKIKLNVEDVYYSPRLSTERKRLVSLVKKRERVLVMFSGNAPYVCVIAKNSLAAEVYGIEINPAGHKYGQENVKLNKLKNVKLFCGDVRKVMPRLKKKGEVFDRIIMPLPKSYEEFLDTAFLCAKKGTVLHLYAFLKEDEFDGVKKVVRRECKKFGFKYRVLGLNKCGQMGPREYRVCVDFKVL